MRLSVDRDDPAYWEPSMGFGIFLDGKSVDRCVTADEALGLVVRHVLDAEGRPVQEGDEFKTETVYGKVEIRPANGHLKKGT